MWAVKTLHKITNETLYSFHIPDNVQTDSVLKLKLTDLLGEPEHMLLY